MENKLMTFEIVEYLGVIGTHDTGWNTELNVVSWNGKEPRLDIRAWDKNHENMTRGISLPIECAGRLSELLNAFVEERA